VAKLGGCGAPSDADDADLPRYDAAPPDVVGGGAIPTSAAYSSIRRRAFEGFRISHGVTTSWLTPTASYASIVA
jgi:hypothetical protein